MKRPAWTLLLLLAMLCQSLASARAGWVAVLTDAEHAAMHWTTETHHHHDDGSVHADDSEDSARHLLADQVSAGGLPADASPPRPQVTTTPPAQHPARAGPQPDPEGPLRPPQRAA